MNLRHIFALAIFSAALSSAQTTALDTDGARNVGNAEAITRAEKDATPRLAIGPTRHNWYVQAGLDLSLQNPYGTPDGSPFVEGRTGGIDIAVGRWFTPQIGLRLRGNWENGFPPLSNDKASWLNFLDLNDPNSKHGGYMSVVGDIQINLHNLIVPYRPDRLWNCMIYPRAGVAFNFGLQKGGPLLGAGLGNTFRINDRYTVFADIDYQMVSSGINGCSTDIGTGSNGYLDITVGLQFNLGKSGFRPVTK